MERFMKLMYVNAGLRALGVVKPLSASMHVVLPAPFGPIKPTMLPSATSKLTELSARTPP
ncbi:unannotated protein [freshwater metagenome]|uniref:Unannotated protein n=1 Tax=freshwater metagenome TaxID=449393 RepID=A0A6J7FF07_9ZZZZ